jgi:hypothetical protein
LGEPVVRFNFGDAPMQGFVSSVDRVVKRHPELGRFVTNASPMPGMAGARRISNGPMSPAAGGAVPFATLQTIAGGRSSVLSVPQFRGPLLCAGIRRVQTVVADRGGNNPGNSADG